MNQEIQIKKKTLVFLASLIFLIIAGIILYNSIKDVSASSLQKQYDSIPTQAGKINFMKQSNQLTQKVDPELLNLDSQIISCGPDVNSLLSANPTSQGSCIAKGDSFQNTNGLTLGGQCCGALMDLKDRNANLVKLQAYKNIQDIILDPFHTPITLAKKWIDYDKNTVLTSDEQKVYDEAMKLSKEGPCCCQCWHWYVNEGISKVMIREYHYSAQQIADFWNASDICGG